MHHSGMSCCGDQKLCSSFVIPARRLRVAQEGRWREIVGRAKQHAHAEGSLKSPMPSSRYSCCRWTIESRVEILGHESRRT